VRTVLYQAAVAETIIETGGATMAARTTSFMRRIGCGLISLNSCCEVTFTSHSHENAQSLVNSIRIRKHSSNVRVEYDPVSGEALAARTELAHAKLLEIIFWKEVVVAICGLFSFVHKLGALVWWPDGH